MYLNEWVNLILWIIIYLYLFHSYIFEMSLLIDVIQIDEVLDGTGRDIILDVVIGRDVT